MTYLLLVLSLDPMLLRGMSEITSFKSNSVSRKRCKLWSNSGYGPCNDLFLLETNDASNFIRSTYTFIIFSLNSSSHDGVGILFSFSSNHNSGLSWKISRITSVSGVKVRMVEDLAFSRSS